MTVKHEGYSSIAPGTNECTCRANITLRKLYKNRRKIHKKVCCMKWKLHIDKYRRCGYDRAKFKTL